MNKNVKWVLLVVLIIFAVWILLRNMGPNHFNKVELDNDNFVVNKTEMTFLDTVIKVGLSEMKYKKIIVVVRKITIDNKDPNITLKAHIIVSRENKNVFLIEIDKNNRQDIIKSISHELIHLDQMYSGKLKSDKDYVIWKGDTLRNTPEYFDREWEIEAVGLGEILEKRINKVLYEKR